MSEITFSLSFSLLLTQLIITSFLPGPVIPFIQNETCLFEGYSWTLSAGMPVKRAPQRKVFEVHGLLPSLCRVGSSPPSAPSSPWQPKLAQSLSTNLSQFFLAYNDISYPYSSFIFFRTQALERPRLEWGTETMNTISCSKVKKKKKKKKDDCIPPLHRLSPTKLCFINAYKSPIFAEQISAFY